MATLATFARMYVADLDAAITSASTAGATLVRAPAEQPTGRNVTVAFGPGGPVVEYVEWNDETRTSVLGRTPPAAGV